MNALATNSVLLQPNSFSKHERDMAMRNSELSFRIRTLEDNLGIMKAHKKSLVSWTIHNYVVIIEE